MNIFNYFGELRKEFKLPEGYFTSYNIINIAGKFIYIEGHKGLLTLSAEEISCKLKSGIIIIKGSNLSIKILTDSTLAVEGKIYKTEVQ